MGNHDQWCIGGLNVVGVIARSSVNASNGATMRLSNGFHGIFLAVFILLFKNLVTGIPLPALAVILVYTGYKLAHPSQFLHRYRIGGQQLLKFSITIVLTIFLGLIKGIALGMFITIIAHLFSVKKVDIILRNLLKTNILMIDELDGTYLISVRYFSNFFNFNRLKARLDTVPYSAKVVVDFSLADFVGHSTLEHLNEYSENFDRNGGEISIIGIDNLAVPTNHPLSPMRPVASKKVKKIKPLTKRQEQLKQYGEDLGWFYEAQEFRTIQGFNDFGYFRTGTLDRGRNSLKGSVGPLKLRACDLDFHEGEFIAKEPKHAGVVVIDLPVEVPEFILDKERLLDRVGQLAGFREVNFKGPPDFNRRF
ncbi:MAG: SulP family inorganic anion transporter [Flavobacteriales bacterium]|nr:SulP family inorganic anion transporter [Flavobacteriales bacterium]